MKTYRNTEHVALVVGIKPYAGEGPTRGSPDYSGHTGEDQHPTERIVFGEYSDNGKGTGFGIDFDSGGWDPGFPALKGGGTFRNNTGRDGGRLIRARLDNVTSTLSVIVNGSDHQDLNNKLARLWRIVSRARRFSAEFAEVSPVYLEWKAHGASIPQFATVYTADIGATYADASGYAMATIEIQFIREPLWTWGVAPGENPNLYRLRLKSPNLPEITVLTGGGSPNTADQNYGLSARSYANTFTDEEHVISAADLNNRHERDPANPADLFAYHNSLGKNYIDIPADELPGDAPAKMFVTWECDSVTFRPKTIYIWHETVMNEEKSDGVTSYWEPHIFNGGDAGWSGAASWVGTPAKVSGVGVLSNGSAVTKYVTDISVGAGAISDGPMIEWGSDNAVGSEGGEDAIFTTRLNPMRGRYAVFLRHNIQSGAAADMDMYVRFIYGRNTDEWEIGGAFTDLPTVNPIATTVTRQSELQYALAYMGDVQVPDASQAENTLEGTGYQFSSSRVLAIQLRMAARAAGSAIEIRVLDLILMKYDEGFAMCEFQADPDATIASSNGHKHGVLYDTTGYLSRNTRDGAFAMAYRGQNEATIEVRGQDIWLQPGMVNRLHFLQDEYHDSSELLSSPLSLANTLNNRDFDVAVIPVPRSYGRCTV